MTPNKTLKELAEYLGGKVLGDENCKVDGLAPLDAAGPDKITFLVRDHHGEASRA